MWHRRADDPAVLALRETMIRPDWLQRIHETGLSWLRHGCRRRTAVEIAVPFWNGCGDARAGTSNPSHWRGQSAPSAPCHPADVDASRSAAASRLLGAQGRHQHIVNGRNELHPARRETYRRIPSTISSVRSSSRAAPRDRPKAAGPPDDHHQRLLTGCRAPH